MTRNEMIRRLVSYSVSTALREPQHYWLQELFENGFAGYRSFSDAKLRRELALRGLHGGDGECEDEADEDAMVHEDLPASLSGYAIYAREPE